MGTDTSCALAVILPIALAGSPSIKQITCIPTLFRFSSGFQIAKHRGNGEITQSVLSYVLISNSTSTTSTLSFVVVIVFLFGKHQISNCLILKHRSQMAQSHNITLSCLKWVSKLWLDGTPWIKRSKHWALSTENRKQTREKGLRVWGQFAGRPRRFWPFVAEIDFHILSSEDKYDTIQASSSLCCTTTHLDGKCFYRFKW